MRAVADQAERSRTRLDRPGEQRALAAAGRLDAMLDRMGGRPFTEHPFIVKIPADRAGWEAERLRVAGPGDPRCLGGSGHRAALIRRRVARTAFSVGR
jgi:hypothetical protein